MQVFHGGGGEEGWGRLSMTWSQNHTMCASSYDSVEMRCACPPCLGWNAATCESVLAAADNIGPSLLVLRDRLGIGATAGAVLLDLEASGRKAFQQLGVATASGGSPFADPCVLRDAARAYLVGCAVKVRPSP